MKTKRGDTMTFITLDDRTARIEVSFFADAYDAAREIIRKDVVLVVEGEVSFDDYSGAMKVRGKGVRTLTQARQHYAKALHVEVSEQAAGNNLGGELRRLLEPSLAGEVPLCIHYKRSDAEGIIRLGDSWQVQPCDDLLQRLKDRFGERSVRLEYDN
jgi:DNA polymerase-3 subunit alpha